MSIFQSIGSFLLTHLPHIGGGAVSLGGGYVAKNKLGSLKEDWNEQKRLTKVTHDTTLKMTDDISTIREESVKQTALLVTLSTSFAETNGYLKAVVGMTLAKK